MEGQLFQFLCYTEPWRFQKPEHKLLPSPNSISLKLIQAFSKHFFVFKVIPKGSPKRPTWATPPSGVPGSQAATDNGKIAFAFSSFFAFPPGSFKVSTALERFRSYFSLYNRLLVWCHRRVIILISLPFQGSDLSGTVSSIFNWQYAATNQPFLV